MDFVSAHKQINLIKTLSRFSDQITEG